jgi:hypothetical protein
MSFLIRNSAKIVAKNVFRDVMPCNLVEIYERFGGNGLLLCSGWKMRYSDVAVRYLILLLGAAVRKSRVIIVAVA